VTCKEISSASSVLKKTEELISFTGVDALLCSCVDDSVQRPLWSSVSALKLKLISPFLCY
jgi:hypothetical protein